MNREKSMGPKEDSLRRSINFIKIPSQTDHEEEKRHSEG
jgi:hypothetical protein